MLQFLQRPEVSRTLVPVLGLLMLGMLWGGSINGAKYVALQGITPFNYTFWVMAVASVILVSINLCRRVHPPIRHIGFYFLCSLFGLTLPQMFMFTAVRSIPAGVMTLFIALTPIATYLFAMLFRSEQPHRLKTYGVLLGFCGTCLIVVPNAFSGAAIPMTGILIGLLAPSTYAIFIAGSGRYRPAELEMVQLSTGMAVASAVTLLLVIAAVDSLYPLWTSFDLVGLMIVYHGIVTAIAYTTLFALVKHSGPLFASQSTYFVTVSGIAIGAYVYKEVLPYWIWIAAVLIFAGLGLIQKARKLSTV